MDTWGLLLIAASLIGYFLTRKRSTGAGTFFLWLFGVGVGLTIGAVWAVAIINNLL